MTAGPRASGRLALGSVGNYAPGDALPLDVRQPPGAGHPGPAASTTQEVNGTGLGAHAEACAFRGTRDQTQNTTPEVKFQGLLSLGRGLPLPDGASCPRCWQSRPSAACRLPSRVLWGGLGQALLPVHLDQLVQLHGGLGVLHRRVSALANLIAEEGRARCHKAAVPSPPAPRPHVLLLRGEWATEGARRALCPVRFKGSSWEIRVLSASTCSVVAVCAMSFHTL